MNNLRGTGEIEVAGVIRPFKFGTNQTAIFCQVQNLTIQQAQELLSPENLKSLNVNPQVMTDFVYSAFKAGALSARKDTDFDAIDVGDWMDENPEILQEMMSVAAGANGPNENRQQRRAGKEK